MSPNDIAWVYAILINICSISNIEHKIYISVISSQCPKTVGDDYSHIEYMMRQRV